VALAALKGDKTLVELAQQYDVNPNQITDWKRQLVERAGQVFGDANSPATADPDLTTLHAKIGRLTLEKDFFRTCAHQGGPAERKTMIDRKHKLPVSQQCSLAWARPYDRVLHAARNFPGRAGADAPHGRASP